MSASPAATPDQHATAAAAPQAHRSSSCSSLLPPSLNTSTVEVLRRPVESALDAEVGVDARLDLVEEFAEVAVVEAGVVDD